MSDDGAGFYEERIDDRIVAVHSPNHDGAASRPWMVKVDGKLLRTKAGVGRRFTAMLGAIEAARVAVRRSSS